MTGRTRRSSVGLWAGAAVLILASSLCETSSQESAARPLPQPGSAEVLFRNFNGVNNFLPADQARRLGVGWVRVGFDWGFMEPEKGHWNWDRTDKYMQNASNLGVQVLPALLFTAAWAAQTPGHRFGPPANVADWENYVERVVARYSSPPYNVRYFQIWNEPAEAHATGFWEGTNQQFVDIIYLRAAKIVHKHGGYVVFGGWNSGNTLQQFDNVLNYHNAWQSTDIVDIHYHTFVDMQSLYQEWVASGKCRGIWQTEVGYTSEPGFSSGFYSRVLNWTLQKGWRDPDEFKLLWYAGLGNGPDADKCLVKPAPGGGTQLTGQGKYLAALNDAIGQGGLSAFTHFSTMPPVTGPYLSAWAIGYRVGSNRIVINFLMDRAFFQAHASVKVSVQTPGQPSTVRLMSELGRSSSLPVEYSGGQAQINVPFRSGFDDCPSCAFVSGYLILE